MVKCKYGSWKRTQYFLFDGNRIIYPSVTNKWNAKILTLQVQVMFEERNEKRDLTIPLQMFGFLLVIYFQYFSFQAIHLDFTHTNNYSIGIEVSIINR